MPVPYAVPMPSCSRSHANDLVLRIVHFGIPVCRLGAGWGVNIVPEIASQDHVRARQFFVYTVIGGHCDVNVLDEWTGDNVAPDISLV